MGPCKAGHPLARFDCSHQPLASLCPLPQRTNDMVAAESAQLSADISTKDEFYDLVCEQREALLGEERNRMTNLSNNSSLLF